MDTFRIVKPRPQAAQIANANNRQSQYYVSPEAGYAFCDIKYARMESNEIYSNPASADDYYIT